MTSTKPKVLVLGGCGFIGRHIIAELIEEDVASLVQVVDKVPPQIAWLNKYHQDIFNHPKVVFKSANLIHPGSCEAVFSEEHFDWVINAAGETKIGQGEAVYKEGICKVSSNCAKIAALIGAKIFLEISSGQISPSDKVAHKEDSECSPWTFTAKYKTEAEMVIQSTPCLNWIIVRPAIVYGPSDKTGLTPRLVVGALYRFLGEKMKVLWDAKLCTNTVHVKDVARAVVWLCERGKAGQVYNLVDDGQTTQGQINDIISDIFNIKYDYWGSTLSSLAKVDIESLLAQVNEKHLAPWAKLCIDGGVENTPLTPYLDRDCLHGRGIRLDGSKIRKEGFTFMVAKPSRKNLIEVLDDFMRMKLFPTNAMFEIA